MAIGRVNCVVQNIGPDLIERIAEDAHGGQLVIVGPLEGDVAHPVSKDYQRVLQPLMNIDDLFRTPIHIRIPFNRTHQLRNAMTAPSDDIGGLARRECSGKPVQRVYQRR